MLPLGAARSAGRTARGRPGAAPASATTLRTRGRLSTRTTRNAASAARHARRLVREQERPLVVVVAPLIEPDRLLLALAHDASHASGNHAAGADRRGHLGARGRTLRQGSARADAASTARGRRRSRWARGRRGSRRSGTALA